MQCRPMSYLLTPMNKLIDELEISSGGLLKKRGRLAWWLQRRFVYQRRRAGWVSRWLAN
ncbi:hypothetical protein LINPERHAP2_LOCUS41741 [Linum perenne]